MKYGMKKKPVKKPAMKKKKGMKKYGK